MKKVDLTKGNVLKVITTLSLPIIGSSILQLTYNFVDMIWVGALGSDSVASIGTSSFLIGLGYSINSLIIIGTGIKVSHAVGQKNEMQTKEYLNAGLFLNLIMALTYGIILVLFGKNFIDFFKIENPVVEKFAYMYLAVSAPALFFTFFNTLYTRVLGSFGNNKEALKISALGVIINVILDPIFIYGLKMGVVGAAIATLIANMTMFILFNIKGRSILIFDKRVGIKYTRIVDIIKLGSPMAFQRVLFTIVNIILARMISSFGSNAIAAQKIGLQIESIMLMVIGGINGAVSCFVGQNYGAKKYKRAILGYNISLVIGLIYAAITSVIVIVFPEMLVKIFVRDLETIKIASTYLVIIGVAEVFASVEMISNGMFSGFGQPKIPAIISIIFTILRIPLAMILVNYIGINGIWWSISISSILKGIISYLLYRVRIWRKYNYVV